MARRRLTRAQKRVKRNLAKPQVKPQKPQKVELQLVLSAMEKAARSMYLRGPIHEVKIEPAEGSQFGLCHGNVQKFCQENPEYTHVCCWNILEEKNPELKHGNGYPFWAQFHSVAKAPDGTYMDVTPTSGDYQIYAGEHESQTRHIVIEESISGPDYMRATTLLQKASGQVMSVNHRFVDFDTRFGEEYSDQTHKGQKLLLIGLKMVTQVVTGKFRKNDPQLAVLRAARKMFLMM